VNLLHVARLWLEGRSTPDDQPVAEWTRFDRVVWVPLRDGRAFGVEFRDPVAFAKVFGAFAVAACGGPDIVRARAAAVTYPDPRPMRARPADVAPGWTLSGRSPWVRIATLWSRRRVLGRARTR
jgi:hypothetical protein